MKNEYNCPPLPQDVLDMVQEMIDSAQKICGVPVVVFNEERMNRTASSAIAMRELAADDILRWSARISEAREDE